MNKLDKLFQTKNESVLNVYFTAGYPSLTDTNRILTSLDNHEVDIIEIGIPYSDPLADGPTIQASSAQALDNGMTLDVLFEQIARQTPLKHSALVLMGYYNQVLQYGAENFFRKCKEVGVSGLILPDLPLHEYESVYKNLFEELDLGISFLMTPQTSNDRIIEIDRLTRGFIYMVSSASITGTSTGISQNQVEYFERVNSLPLTNPRLIGFGISDFKSFNTACQYSQGAIIGSAFIRALQSGDKLESSIRTFIQNIKVDSPKPI